MPTSASAAKMALNRLVPGVALRRAALSPRHRIAMRPRRAVESEIENGSGFMIVLLPAQRSNAARAAVEMHADGQCRAVRILSGFVKYERGTADLTMP